MSLSCVSPEMLNHYYIGIIPMFIEAYLNFKMLLYVINS